MNKIKKLSLCCLITAGSALALSQGGVGHSTSMTVSNSTALAHVDFTKHLTNDFNRDGIIDRLICGNVKINGQSRLNVRIIDGKSGLDLYKWNGYAGQSVGGDGRVQKLTSCDIVNLRPHFPSIVMSTVYDIPGYGYRGISRQYLIQNTATTTNQFAVKVQTIKIPNSDSNFASAARNVKCTQVTNFFKQRGYADGAYCFYAGYDGAIPGGGSGTVTAFVKFQHGSNNSLVVKDLTNSSGLMWNGGMRGTYLSRFPSAKLCNGSAKYDGLHMMGSAFVDFDRNGTPDFISIGQHASLRLHKMIYNAGKNEGVQFQTSTIDPQGSGMSEYLRIQSFEEDEYSAKSNCVYISGERSNNCTDTPDHFRCFKDNKWQTFYPEGGKFSSTMGTMSIKATGQGALAIKVPYYNGSSKAGDKYFQLGGAFERKLQLWAPTTSKSNNQNVVISGWACVPNTRWRPNIIVSTTQKPSISGYKEVWRQLTHIKVGTLPTRLKQFCMQPADIPLKFQAVIPRTSLPKSSGKLYIRADMYHMQNANVPPVYRETNY